MKTLQEQYNLIKEGKGAKDVFLKEAKLQYPSMINNAANFTQAANILKRRSVIQENYVDLKPVSSWEAPAKPTWESKFNSFLNEAGDKSLNPIVNRGDGNDLSMKYNTKEQDEKVSADPKYKFEVENGSYGSYKNISDGVENVASHNYDYSPTVDNINNVNGQEMLNGVYVETKYNPELTLEAAQALAIKNLAKDPLHYVKNGQFGVKDLGYQQPATQENDGKTYGGSGFSDKLKDSDNNWAVVKESIQKIVKENIAVGKGNPNSLASLSGEVIKQMMNESGLQWTPVKEAESLQDFETEKPMEPEVKENAVDKAIDASQDKAGMEEEARPDYPDVDGDGDKDESMEKALKDKKEKKKKVKKESIDSKLAEIGKEAEQVKMEAQLDFLHDHIQEKVDRVSSIQEDENLSELIDKSKMKQMQREIKDLEKKKAKMEKLYEKSCGKKYSKKEMVDETEEVDESFDSVVDDIMDQGKSREDAEKIAGAINAKYVGNYK
jgi:hypothetical protein